jgi:uncharacterized protein HemX
MSRKAIFFTAGIITSILLVLVFGLAGGANRLNQPVSASSPGSSASSTANPAATAGTQVCVNPADVTNLQAQLNQYQVALQQANAQLQAAYNQISALQAQQGRFRGGDDENGGFFNPFGGE